MFSFLRNDNLRLILINLVKSLKQGLLRKKYQSIGKKNLVHCNSLWLTKVEQRNYTATIQKRRIRKLTLVFISNISVSVTELWVDSIITQVSLHLQTSKKIYCGSLPVSWKKENLIYNTWRCLHINLTRQTVSFWLSIRLSYTYPHVNFEPLMLNNLNLHEDAHISILQTVPLLL